MADAFLRDPVVLTPEQALQRQPAHASEQLGEEEGPETLVLVNNPALRDLFVDVLGAAPTDKRVGPVELLTSEAFGGAGLIYPGVGAPAAGLALERCIAAGTQRVLFLGFSAALAPHTESGQACLVTGAHPHDGFTSHYAGPGYQPEPDGGLTRTLREATEVEHEGVVWTTDAPYRETLDVLERQRDQGVLAVDMETSAVLTLCAYREVPCGALTVTTDEVRDDGWVPCEPGAADEGVRDAVRGIVAVLKGLRNLRR